MPQQVARLIRATNLLDVEPRLALLTLNNQTDLTSTKSLKQALLDQKFPNPGIDLNRVHRRQDLPNLGSDSQVEHFSKLWQIKHPALRAIRLKLCHKNIFSNERRHRFGLSDSPFCTSCLLIETVEHQLFECANAQRLWLMYRNIAGQEISSFADLLLCSSSIELESLKSAIIKALIQINRSHSVPEKVIAQECAHFLRIEAIVNSPARTRLLNLVNKLNGIP